MSKIILEFNTEDEYFEELAAKRAIHATDAFLVLLDIQKYLSEREKDLDYFYGCLEHRGIDMSWLP